MCAHPEIITTHILLFIKGHEFQMLSDVKLETDTVTPKVTIIN